MSMKSEKSKELLSPKLDENEYALDAGQYEKIRNYVIAMPIGSFITVSKVCGLVGVSVGYNHEMREILMGFVEHGLLTLDTNEMFCRTTRGWKLDTDVKGIKKDNQKVTNYHRERLRRVCAVNAGQVYDFLLEALQGYMTHLVPNKRTGELEVVSQPIPAKERLKIARYLFDKALPDLKSIEVPGDKERPVKINFVVEEKSLPPTSNNQTIEVESEVE